MAMYLMQLIVWTILTPVSPIMKAVCHGGIVYQVVQVELIGQSQLADRLFYLAIPRKSRVLRIGGTW
ncbi:hypothetical protein D3C87_2042520 [compost metagenome]